MATDILTTRAVAERFGVAISTVTRWVADGHLQPFHKTPGLRGQFLFDRADVDRFADQRAAYNRLPLLGRDGCPQPTATRPAR